MAYTPKSCGLVLVRKGLDGLEYLLLTSRKWGEPGFPKGHVDLGESELDTALRETREETGISELEVLGRFRTAIGYPVRRKGKDYEKTAVYFAGRTRAEAVRLSDEHTSYTWCRYEEARGLLPHENARAVLRDAALYLKDTALFAAEPASEADADAHLATLPDAHPMLVAHLRGSARLARTFAEALVASGQDVNVDAAAMGALLHDVGRALGHHNDHQVAGVRHLRETRWAAYGYACISHFTKGATAEDLLEADLAKETLEAFEALVDPTTFTWEERCVALADSCMSMNQAVRPVERFAALRERYGAVPIIDLQERRTEAIRQELAAVIGRDPLEGVT